MRNIVVAGLVLLTGACTTESAGDLRLTEARSIVRQYAEEMVDSSLASLSRSGVLDDIDCTQETGIDAKQCIAFTTLMESRMATLRAEERKIAMSEAGDEIEALATAMTKLSAPDFSVLQANASVPMGSDLTKPISPEGEKLIEEQWDALDASLLASDRRAGDTVQALVMEVLTKLMADPALQGQ